VKNFLKKHAYNTGVTAQGTLFQIPKERFDTDHINKFVFLCGNENISTCWTRPTGILHKLYSWGGGTLFKQGSWLVLQVI